METGSRGHFNMVKHHIFCFYAVFEHFIASQRSTFFSFVFNATNPCLAVCMHFNRAVSDAHKSASRRLYAFQSRRFKCVQVASQTSLALIRCKFLPHLSEYPSTAIAPGLQQTSMNGPTPTVITRKSTCHLNIRLPAITGISK